jgi:hypothetical protein
MIETPLITGVLLFLSKTLGLFELLKFYLLIQFSSLSFTFTTLLFFLIYFYFSLLWQLLQNFGTSFPLQIKFTEHRWK